MAEVYLGQAFKDLKVKREDIVISTKLFFGSEGFFLGQKSPNSIGLSRKHIIEGIKASLKRLQMDYVDVIFAHTYDHDTPIEEVVRAFSWVIDQGLAFYWGTSGWNADHTTEAIQFARAHGLHEPVTEQCQYNMLVRDSFEKDYESLFAKYKYGSTVWSPLGQGVLTGRYNDGNIPEGRFTFESSFKSIKDMVMNFFFSPEKKEKSLEILKALAELSKELGFSQTQVAIAWALANRDASTLILGFSKASYIDENMKALELYKKWTPELEKRIGEILNNQPQPSVNGRTF